MDLTGTCVGKPTPADLGIDPEKQSWQRSGQGDGSLEVAFPTAPSTVPSTVPSTGSSTGPAGWAHGDWVLMRVAGDAAGRVLVFDRNEWECFLDGARKGEFDDAATD